MDSDGLSSNEPLQLVEVASSDGSLTLLKRNLLQVLAPVENLPLSVVSVAGPPKNGKSLLFGYLIRYFLAAEKDELDWMDWENPDKELTTVAWPRDGKSPDTLGIWSYHRPFQLTMEDGSDTKKVGVLLLYTQSASENTWDAENNEVCALMGLTIHISSNIVFNVHKRLDEKCLSAVNAYIKYALEYGSLPTKGKKDKNSQPPLQSACFLLRDWNFPSDFPYGIKGGRNYVKVEKLQANVKHSRRSRETLQLISGLFQDISGCLLPFPGVGVIDKDFQGSVAEMSGEFAKHLEDFINNQINIDQLILKKDSAGNLMSGKLLRESMEQFVKKAGESEGESLDNGKFLRRYHIKVLETANDQKEYIKPAMQTYAEVWRKYQKKGKRLDDKALKDIQKKARQAAIQTLEKNVCRKDENEDDDDENSNDSEEDEQPQVDEGVKKQLTERILKRFGEIKQEEAKKQLERMEKYKHEMIRQYQDIMTGNFLDSGRKPSETVFRRESKATIATLQADFLGKIGADGDRLEERAKEQVENLMDGFEEEEQAFHDKIFGTGKEKEKVSAVGSRRTLGPLSTDSGLENSKLSLNQSLLSVSSHQSDEMSTDGFRGVVRERVQKSSPPKMQRESKEALRKHEESLRERAKLLVDRLAQDHSRRLGQHLENADVDLESIHATCMAEILQRFEDEVSYERERSEHKLYMDILISDCKSTLSSAKAKQKRAKKQKQVNLEGAKTTAVRNFEKRLTEFLNGDDEASVEELERESRVVEKEILDGFVGGVGDVASVKREMRSILDKLKDQISMKQQNSTTKLAAEYIRKMKDAAGKAKGEQELKVAYEKITKELHKALKTMGHSTSASLKNQKYIQELEESLKAAYIDGQDRIKTQQRHDLGSAKLGARQAREYYCLEMEKRLESREFLSEEALLKLHKRTCDSALKTFPDADQSEVKSMLTTAFQKYQDENSMNKNDEPAIGIDLGTTYCCVSVYQRGKVVILPNSIGKYTTPSYVQFPGSGTEIVGEPAKTRAYENPEGTIFDAKRILGRRFDDPKLQEDMKLWPFTVVDGGHGIPMIEVNGKRVNPEVISSKILKQLKKDAEEHLKTKVTKAVITVPAYFTDGQKQATIDAGKMAGLEVLSILTEPVAAAMAYKLQYSTGESGDDERHILVFDLGGGTFDVAVLKASKGKLDVLTVDGDTHLGGEDFDRNLMTYCAQEFKKAHNVDLFEGKDSPAKKTRDDVRRQLKRLQAMCETQKIALTTARSVDVNVDNIHKNLDLDVTVTRATFEKINAPLFDKTLQVVQSALKEAKLDKSKVTDIVLVGGSTRIPKVQQMLQEYFQGKDLDKKINPDEAVAHGAGLMAAIKQGSVQQGSRAFTKIQDVTPMSLGVELYGGGFSPIIRKGTKTPVMLKEVYKTAHNNQTSVQITIYEGEDKIAKENMHLGDFYLNGIPPKDAGVENIDVEMVINDQGILHVTAKCRSSGTKSTVTVTENKQRMGQAAIQRYLAEATIQKF